ncbi:LysR family transcriptional regulator [Clostridium lundense]|uniref:LysR family transcriptional regulator n=1 Tax=Clostridium lundense TaxID=319475 RepID=UPI00048517C7|nr:LysR family transcriptional regulator [Clostridium lundense]
MEFKQIQQIIEIAKTASISKAAQNLYISQPNLSLSIKNLETELGAELFIRTTKGIELTEFGEQFLTYSKPVYQQFLQLGEICEYVIHEDRKIFSVSTVTLKFVYNVFVNLYQKHGEENIYFSHNEGTTTQVIEDVYKQNSHIGIIIFTSLQRKSVMRILKLKELEYTRLSIEPPYVIVSTSNPYFYKDIDSVDLQELSSYPFIASYGDIFYSSSNEMSTMGSIGKLARSSKIYVSNRACLYDFLYRTNAFSICSNNAVAYKEERAYEKIRPIPIKSPGFNFEIGWIKRKNYVISPIAGEFINDVVQTIKD